MTDENKNVDEVQTAEVKKEKCLCKKLGESECLKNFITITLGTFAGVYIALSLFAYVHKPPVFMHKIPNPPCHMQMYNPVEFNHPNHHGLNGPQRNFDGGHKQFKGHHGEKGEFKKFNNHHRHDIKDIQGEQPQE